MKKNVSILLRAGVFSLAAVFAFAFTQPTNDDDPRFRLENGNWIEVTGEIGVNYQCDDVSPLCTAKLVNNDPILGEIREGTEQFGVFSMID